MNIQELIPSLEDSFPNAAIQKDNAGVSVIVYPMILKIFNIADTVQCTISITKRNKEQLPISVITHSSNSIQEFIEDLKVQLNRFMLLSRACYKCTEKLLGDTNASPSNSAN